LLITIIDVKKFHPPFLQAKRTKNWTQFLEALYINKRIIFNLTYIYKFFIS